MLYQSYKKGHGENFVVIDSTANVSNRLGRIRRWLQERRTDLIYTALDQEQVIFLFFPLLSYFNFEMIKYGYIVATISYLVWIAFIKYPRQIRRILEEDRKADKVKK